MKRIIGLIWFLSLSASVWADDPWDGTWVERSAAPMTMTVEKSGGGTKFSYRMPAGSTPNFVLSFEAQFDDKEAPVMIDGKPSGETMTIKRIDDRHASSAWKIQGSPVGTSTSELSADGKVIKAESDNTMPGPNGAAGKITQYWDKK